MKDVSILIPLYNEEESVSELLEWIETVFSSFQKSYEVIFLDDGSTDSSWEVLRSLSRKNPNVRAIRFRRNYGKSAALNTGFQECQGRVVITMDADLQDSPEEIPLLYNKILDEGLDIVSGWKKKRHDPITKTIPTKLYNAVARWVSGISLHDFNCGLKAYRLEVVKNIEVYGEMHRYIPMIAKWSGFNKIGEHVVHHQSRKYGKSKFGLERFINGFLDLLSITFVGRFGKRPMHLFGFLGTLMFILGLGIVVWMGAYKLYCIQQGITARLVTDQPQFYIALTSMILGTMLFLVGFLAEMIARNAPNRNMYAIKESLNLDSTRASVYTDSE